MRRSSNCPAFFPDFYVKIFLKISRASGPLMRTIPIPLSPGAVATAATVCSIPSTSFRHTRRLSADNAAALCDSSAHPRTGAAVCHPNDVFQYNERKVQNAQRHPEPVSNQKIPASPIGSTGGSRLRRPPHMSPYHPYPKPPQIRKPTASVRSRLCGSVRRLRFWSSLSDWTEERNESHLIHTDSSAPALRFCQT